MRFIAKFSSLPPVSISNSTFNFHSLILFTIASRFGIVLLIIIIWNFESSISIVDSGDHDGVAIAVILFLCKLLSKMVLVMVLKRRLNALFSLRVADKPPVRNILKIKWISHVFRYGDTIEVCVVASWSWIFHAYCFLELCNLSRYLELFMKTVDYYFWAGSRKFFDKIL